jgi:hypothetical protein
VTLGLSTGMAVYGIHGENKSFFDEIMTAFYKTNTLSWIFIKLVPLNNMYSPQEEIKVRTSYISMRK